MKGIYVVTFEDGNASKKEIKKALRAIGLKGVQVAGGQKTKIVNIDIPLKKGGDRCTTYETTIDGGFKVTSFTRPEAVANQVTGK